LVVRFIAANGFGLGDGCEALDCAVGQLAPNPCYKMYYFFERGQITKI